MIVVLFFAAAALMRSAWERKQLKTEIYCFESKYAKEDIRAVFLTDVHNRLSKEGISLILEKIYKANPDIVLMGGDIITARKVYKDTNELGMLKELISGLPKGCPCFYAEGNHESVVKEACPEAFEKFKGILDESGAVYLNDSCAVYKGIAVYGLTLDCRYYKKGMPSIFSKPSRLKLESRYMFNKLGAPRRDKFNLVMIHSPLFLKEASEWGADLVLSGHFHGGTVRLPILGGVMTPQFQFFLKECAGLHRIGNTYMAVSRGIGTHSINIRLNNFPELTVIDIRKKGV